MPFYYDVATVSNLENLKFGGGSGGFGGDGGGSCGGGCGGKIQSSSWLINGEKNG